MSVEGDTNELNHQSGQERSGVPDLEALLNPDEQMRFRRLCLPTEADELTQMADTIQLHLQQVKANALPATDSETAELLADRLVELVTSGGDLTADDRSLVRGAVEYFLLTSDADDDLSDTLGFDDDVRVFNSVVRRLNRAEMAIHLADLE